jgi:hypothetical protein
MRTTTIILVALLALSVIANAVLGYTSVTFFIKNNQQQLTMTKQAQTIADTQTRLATTITQYNDVVASLNSATAANDELTVRVDQLEDEAIRTTKTMNDYRIRMNVAEYFMKNTQCPTVIDEYKVNQADTNGEIKQSILVALESMYGGAITSSNYATYWNDNKSVMLTTVWGAEGSTKTIVSWDREGKYILSIYDVGIGCVMYTRDRGESW